MVFRTVDCYTLYIICQMFTFEHSQTFMLSNKLLYYSLVNAVVIYDSNLQLEVIRRASFRQALRLQVHMMDNLKEDRTDDKSLYSILAEMESQCKWRLHDGGISKMYKTSNFTLRYSIYDNIFWEHTHM